MFASRFDPRPIFRVGLLCLACALSSSVARAQCPPPPIGDPSPPNSTIPCGIVLTGTTGGVADPRGEFYVVHRDLANNPVVGCEIEIHFGGCSDIRISENQPFPGVTVECLGTNTIVRAVTDANGIAHFRIVGGAVASTPGVGSGAKCGQVWAGKVFLGNITVSAFDLNLVGGLNPVDISLWLVDLFAFPSFVGRGDYNCSGNLNPADLAVLLQASFSGGSTQSAASYCQ